MIGPSTPSSPAAFSVEAQLAEIRDERKYLNEQLSLVEADLNKLKEIRSQSSPANGGTKLPPDKWRELQEQMSEDVTAINQINARLSVLKSEESRLTQPAEPERAPVSHQSRSTSLEALFMEEAKSSLAPEVFEALLGAARQRRQSIVSADHFQASPREQGRSQHRGDHPRQNRGYHDRRNGHHPRGRNHRHN